MSEKGTRRERGNLGKSKANISREEKEPCNAKKKVQFIRVGIIGGWEHCFYLSLADLLVSGLRS